jgi:uncharacterized membrane protein
MPASSFLSPSPPPGFLEPGCFYAYNPRVNNSLLSRWRAAFLTGLAVALPALITLAIVAWLFGSVANFTDRLLCFLPATLTHSKEGEGPMYWYWSVVALMLAVMLISLLGMFARYYFGQAMIRWMDGAMLHVPLVNKIYSAIKQVNEAFTSNKKHSFKTVVLIEFPRKGMYSIGFVTGEQQPETQEGRMPANIVSVFIPTTPNPTSGFLVLVPESEVIKLEMSVTDGIKYIVSLGAVSPELQSSAPLPPHSSPA